MRITKWYIVVAIFFAGLLFSFRNTIAPAQRVANFYDVRLDSLLQVSSFFESACADTASSKQELLSYFFACRNAYKEVELFVDVFDPYKAQMLNGPDLLKIEEENPSDSVIPHGLQVMESILYADTLAVQELAGEVKLFKENVARLRSETDRIYYFRDDRIWHALRTAVYRCVSLGITGFDVPLSFHALPETRRVLVTVKTVAGYYKREMGDSMFNAGAGFCARADQYLAQHNDFDKFDRLVFVRDYIEPISLWLTVCARRLKYINYSQRLPFNQDATSLFAANIVDISFFANSKYGVTPARVQLGRRLFYDQVLSGDGGRSCASCHKPGLAFTDGLAKPVDVGGSKLLQRNTPTLWNAGLQTRQFYDMRTETLENQLSAVVHNADEMNGSLRKSVGRLKSDKEYAALFEKAYAHDGEKITEYNVANAISCYVRSLVSFNSRFDKYMRRQGLLTVKERNGFNLFMGKAKCGTCHFAPLFNGLVPPFYDKVEAEILGVPAADSAGAALDDDAGTAGFTKVPLHRHAFRTSTVRNSGLTAPYMHNGAFRTLEDVVRFYNDGGGAGRGINIATQTLPADKLNLTDSEMKDIVAFLHTLTDTSGTSFGKQLVK